MAHVTLVLEDDGDLREALLMTLEDAGYEAHGAVTGAQALALAARHRIDVAVADVRLEGPDGIDTLRALKRASPELLCIVMTGYADEEAPGRALEVQVDDYLYKPFKARDLLTTLRRLEGKRQEQAGYDALFSRVLQGYRPLILAPVEEARHGAFRSFYVGVRSGQVSLQQGLQLWDLLELAELRRDELADNEGGGADHARLRKGYLALQQTVAALRHSQLAERPRRPGQLTEELFAPLYLKIKAGRLSLELLKAAPMLRQSDAVALCTDPALRALRDSVWHG